MHTSNSALTVTPYDASQTQGYRRSVPHADLVPESTMRTLLTALALGLALPSVAIAKPAKIDKGHSGVMFKAHHFGAGYTWGRFNDFGGTVDMDGSELKGVDIRIEAASIDTGIEKRDKHLRSPDFFDAETHADVTFKSTKVVKKADGVYDVTGMLGLHGVDKEITVEMRHTGEGDLPAMMGGAHVTGWETAFPINQTDHGMSYDAIGETAFVYVNLEVKS